MPVTMIPSRLRVVTVGIAVLAVSISGLTGCSRRGNEAAAEFVDNIPLPDEPFVEDVDELGRHGGRYILGQTNSPKTFNPMMENETSSSDITNNLYASLTSFNNATQESEPGLAKTWELAPDGLTWTFHLRRGAAFSDGRPLTSADVLFSFEVAYDPTLHPSVQDLLQMNGKNFEVTAPDEYTVTIRTPEPNAMLVNLASAVRILPKHVLEPQFKAGTFGSAYNVSTPPEQIVTSGAWRLKQYVANEKTVLARNPYYFGVDPQKRRLPYLDELIFLVVPDQDAADLKFRSGELDGLDNVKPENYRWYEENQAAGNFTLYDLGPALNTNFFWFNLNPVRKAAPGRKIGEPHVGAVKYSWFGNSAFRRAVSMAVDRDGMIPSIFFGNGVKNWSLATPGNKIWHDPDVVRYDHDVEEARRLLAGLGWKDGNGDGVLEDTKGNPVSFSLKTNSDNMLRVAMANFIRDDLAKVGIRVTLVPVDFNTLITNIRDDFQYDAILLGLQSGVPPDPGMSQNVWRSSGRTHFWNMAQPKPETPEEARIDQLMDVIVSTPDLEKRKAASNEVDRIANEQGWFVWLPTPTIKLPVRNRFGNVHPTVIPHRLIWNVHKIFVKTPQDPT
jgi:peptide/nickel transport system substrate-binding protein